MFRKDRGMSRANYLASKSHVPVWVELMMRMNLKATFNPIDRDRE